MVGIHILNPFLFVFTKVMPRIIGPYYRAFGVTGVLALPFITLTLEKVGYDTFLAARGRDLDAEPDVAQRDAQPRRHAQVVGPVRGVLG